METCRYGVHHADSKKSSRNLILDLCWVGAAISGAIPMLYSPHNGTILRQAIRRKAEGIADGVAESIEDRIGQLSDMFIEKLEMIKDELKSRIGVAIN